MLVGLNSGDIMATNYARARYDEVYDFGTKSGEVTVIGIHTPSVKSGAVNRATPYQMLSGFFNQFRKFRYSGARVTIVPAAQLPADPLQVSFEAGQPTIDPRDLLNPILFHGCHGESLAQALDSVFGDSGHVFDTPSFDVDGKPIAQSLISNEYYSALTDKTWRKFGVQSPAKLPNLYPLVWKAGTTFPMVGEAGMMNSFDVMNTISTQLKAAGQQGLLADLIHSGMMFNPPMEYRFNSDGTTGENYGAQRFLSYGASRLGWLPTSVSNSVLNEGPVDASVRPSPLLPKLFMGVLMFPPSYTQELYFRMTITHYFEFKDFQGVSLGVGLPVNPYYENLPDIGGKSFEVTDTIETLDSDSNIILSSSGVV